MFFIFLFRAAFSLWSQLYYLFFLCEFARSRIVAIVRICIPHCDLMFCFDDCVSAHLPMSVFYFICDDFFPYRMLNGRAKCVCVCGLVGWLVDRFIRFLHSTHLAHRHTPFYTLELATQTYTDCTPIISRLKYDISSDIFKFYLHSAEFRFEIA